MAQRFLVRCHSVVAGTVLLLVVLLAGAFLWLVLGKLLHEAEHEVEVRFDLVAQDVFDDVRGVLNDTRRYIEVLAALAGDQPEQSPVLGVESLARSLMASALLQDVQVAWPNDNYTIVSLTTPGLPAAGLDAAPAGARYQASQTSARADGHRTSRTVFHAVDGAPVAQRERTTEYRPTSRSWYQQAIARGSSYLGEPLTYAAGGKAGIGVVLATPMRGKQGVVSTAVSLTAFDAIMQRLDLSPNGAAAVVDQQLNVLALRTSGSGYGEVQAAPQRLVKLGAAGSPVLAQLAGTRFVREDVSAGRATLEGVPFIVESRSIEAIQGIQYRILVFAPLSDFTVALDRSRHEVLAIAAAILLLVLPLTWYGARRASRALEVLADDAERIRRLDFSAPPERVVSVVHEIAALGQAQDMMRTSLAERTLALDSANRKLSQLVEVGMQLTRENNRAKLLRDVLSIVSDTTHCEAGTVRIRDAQDVLQLAAGTGDVGVPFIDMPMRDPATGEPSHRYIGTHTAWTGITTAIDHVDTDPSDGLDGLKQLNRTRAQPIVSVLSVALAAPGGKVVGVLTLFNARDADNGRAVPFAPDVVHFVEALASQAAVAIENQNLMQAQRDLMDSIIRMLTSAIDAKSAYTGGHCERVPELAFMLAEEAVKVDEGPLADFRFKTDAEWHEFRIGAWLHDCGKVTTPEHVMDKATKLETIHNRVHEIRMRFEVLQRDARIAALQAIADGQDPGAAWSAFEARARQLQDDFAFIAECNIGGEVMAPERITRLQGIATQTWMRHFDDRLGLSHGELARYGDAPRPALPVQEALIADRPHHIVPRGAEWTQDPKYGFQVNVPRHLYNHGELHNLSISRGTLNAEERFKINDHIIQTIAMLEDTPFPQNMRRVPEYAGTHHETLIGTGYPRKLDASRLSVPARIMAIADIFEALTAGDRPYKKAKSLSEAVHILHGFKRDQHIDPVLFDLFLRTGVYRRYAERFLPPEQIDEVDIAAYMA